MRLDDGDAKLQSALIRHSGCRTCATGRTRADWRCCGRRTHEMRRVDLDLVAPLGAHFAQGELRVFKEDGVLHVAETDRYA